MSVLDFRPRKFPCRTMYLANFMLYNMLGHLWLDGKECPWPTLSVAKETVLDETANELGLERI